MDWTIKDAGEANHNPRVVVNGVPGTEPLVLDAQVGTPVTLDAAGTTDPDGDTLTFTWFFYPEAGTGIPGQPVRRAADAARGRCRQPGPGRHPSGARRRAARAAAARRDRERERPAGDRHAEGRRASPT